MSGQFQLLKSKRFLPLFITQFLGAFNDNVLKNALIIMITFQGAKLTTLNPGLMVNICAGLFILPFFLFSATAGQLADKYEKSMLMRYIKIAEIIIMMIATVGFLLMSLPLLLISLFAMGIHSTLFGPLKYSIIPQHLEKSELIGGNALIESGTFLAILLGTIAGGTLIALSDNGPLIVSITCLIIAIAGYISSKSIQVAVPPAPLLKINLNPITETWNNLKMCKNNRAVFLSIMGISWFWFYGAMFLSQFPAFAKEVLHGNESVVTLLLAIFSVSIAIGSLLCEKFASKGYSLTMVMLGVIGLSIFAVGLSNDVSHIQEIGSVVGAAEFLQDKNNYGVIFNLGMIGVSGGLFCVPLYTLLQIKSDDEKRSRMIAANNIVNAFFMVCAAVLAMVGINAGYSVLQLFSTTALINLIIVGLMAILAPEVFTEAWNKIFKKDPQ